MLKATRSTNGLRMYIISRITEGSGNVWEGERTTRGDGSTVSALPLRRRVIARRALVKWSGSKLPLSTSTATSSICHRMIRRGRRACQPRAPPNPPGPSERCVRRKRRLAGRSASRRLPGDEPANEAARQGEPLETSTDRTFRGQPKERFTQHDGDYASSGATGGATRRRRGGHPRAVRRPRPPPRRDRGRRAPPRARCRRERSRRRGRARVRASGHARRAGARRSAR